MKVLHLGKFCPPNEGGIEIFTIDLLEFLNSKGIRSDLLCFGNSTYETVYKGFNVYSCKTCFKFNSAPLSVDFIKKFGELVNEYDIVHVHCPNTLAELLLLFYHKKVIIHWHSDIVKQKILYKLYKPIQQYLLEKAVKIIVTSPDYLASSKQIKNFKNKSVIISLGLNRKRLDKINKNDYNDLYKIKKGKIVLTIGRLVKYKGFDYLIEAAKYLNDNVTVLIAGTGPLHQSLLKKVNQLNLNAKVSLVGKVNAISDFIKYCDLFCLPSISRNEAFGLVLVEALNFGKPLVTTNVVGSGMNYINKEGITGLVVPPRNPEALAEAINKILSDNEMYNYFSQNARKRAEEFRIESIGEKIVDLYNTVINN